MTVTIDANVLLYAQDRTSSFHTIARQALEGELRTGEPVFLFSGVVVAFLRVSTQAGVFPRALTPQQALDNIRQLLSLPHVNLGLPDEAFVDELQRVLTESDASGRLVHDAEIVTLMRTHGVRRILTADRDFFRFPGVEVTLLKR